MTVIIQITCYYMALGHNVDDPAFYSADGYMLNTCLDPEKQSWLDWCSSWMLEDGFFMSDAHQESGVLIFFFMTLLFVLALIFTFGLTSLFIVQAKNFCSGMTTMERIGQQSYRNRRLNYVENIEETAILEEQLIDQEERKVNPAGINISRLNSQDSYMRFHE